MKKFIKNKNKGFTIVELIVVMAIIAILILIAVPTFTRYIQDANETAEAGTGNTVYKSAMAATVDTFVSTEDVSLDALTAEINDGVSGNDGILVQTYVPTTDGTAPTFTASTTAWRVAIPVTSTSTAAVLDVDATADIFVCAPSTEHVYENGILVEE